MSERDWNEIPTEDLLAMWENGEPVTVLVSTVPLLNYEQNRPCAAPTPTERESK